MKKTSLFTLLGVSLLFLCMINPVSAVGIFRNSVGNWYLDYNNTGTVDKTIHFGAPGDIPITGDWDGNGIDGTAVFRPSTGYWYFDNNFDGSVDKSFRYGGSTDQIIKGDWDGDGMDGIAIFRPSTGYWYFDYNLDGTVDRSFRYGGKTDRIIVGRWQGNHDGIAIFRPSTGYWYFDYNLDGTVDRSFRYGGSTDQIIKGDWDGDGIDGIAIFRPSTGDWYFDYNLDGTVDRSFRFGGSSDQIAKGDWHGTGTEGIAIFRPSTGYWYFDNNLDGTVDRSFRYGGSTDRIVVGNWTSVASDAPVADFTANLQSGYAPLTVTFTDQSTGLAPLTYAWDFTNDGTIDSTQPNPSFTYSTPGNYTVRHTVTNVVGTNGMIKTGYITVSPAPVAPTAQFSAEVLSGYAPLEVHFTNQSTGTAPLTYAWDFGDGQSSSELASPTFTYDIPGTYTVTLTATNVAGSDAEVKNGYITVIEVPTPPTASFTSNRRSGSVPLTVRFTDTSTGSAPMTYAWNFGDGDTSTDQNPTHTYTATGSYTVTLRATNSLGSDTATTIGNITVTEAPPGGPHAGIAITFDDAYIEQWYAIRPMLQQYNAHVTFFVSGDFASMDESQIDMLRTLQADGNEIAFHGMYHTEAAPYLQNHTVQQYLNYEIIPGIDRMRAAGFDPVDFAYPGGSDTPAATQALEGYFGHIRDTYYGWDEAIYYTQGSNQPFIAGIGIDDTTYGNSINDIYNGISRAQDDDTVLIMYGHEPRQTVTGMYQTSYDRLDKILKYASDNNVRFYTVRELT